MKINIFKETSFSTKIIILSFFLFFFAVESTFTILSILFPIFLMVFHTIIINKNLKIKSDLTFIILTIIEFTFFISSLISIYRFGLSINVLFQMFYQLIIYFWFISAINNNYDIKNINSIIDAYIIVSVVASLYMLYENLILKVSFFGIRTFFGAMLDKNFLGAFICVAAVYSFRNILYYGAYLGKI